MLILLKDIPTWLQQSDFYKSLDKKNTEESENSIEIPDDKIKETNDITTINDFIQIYFVCKYWGLDYPESFYKFGLENKKLALKFFYSEYDESNKEINFLIDELSSSDIME